MSASYLPTLTVSVVSCARWLIGKAEFSRLNVFLLQPMNWHVNAAAFCVLLSSCAAHKEVAQFDTLNVARISAWWAFHNIEWKLQDTTISIVCSGDSTPNVQTTIRHARLNRQDNVQVAKADTTTLHRSSQKKNTAGRYVAPADSILKYHIITIIVSLIGFLLALVVISVFRFKG